MIESLPSINHFKYWKFFMKFFAVLVSACIVLSGINVAEARRGGGSRTKSCQSRQPYQS